MGEKKRSKLGRVDIRGFAVVSLVCLTLLNDQTRSAF